MHIYALPLAWPLLAAATWSWPTEDQRVFGSEHTPSGSEWTTFEHPINRVAVIGAGPAGLQAAAALADHNFTVRLFERAPSPGGNWFYTEEVPVRESYPDPPLEPEYSIPNVTLPYTRIYKDGEDGLSVDERWREHWLPRPIWNSLETNSPAVITGMPDVPYADDQSWTISGLTIQAHVRAYASVHKINSNDAPTSNFRASYATRVERLSKTSSSSLEPAQWALTLRHFERLPETNRIKSTWYEEKFDAVVVATGPYSTPHVPETDGIRNWSSARNEDGSYPIYHSRAYRRPESYAGKVVLVVGAGVSGSEIARDIDGYATKILTSRREKELDWDELHPFQRRSIRRFPASTEFIPEIARFEHLPALNKGIKDGKIVLINGTVLQGVDEIILSTGYRRANPFLTGLLNDTLGNQEEDVAPKPPNDIFGGNPLKNLHWTGHYISDPTIAFTNVRPWTAGKYQSYGLAKVWEGTARIPNEEEMWRQYNDTSGRYSFRGLFGTGPSEAIVRQYVTWLNNESLVHGGRLVGPWPVKNWEVFSYYANQEWEKDYITSENFTRFENLPAEDWGSTNLWDAAVMEDVYW